MNPADLMKLSSRLKIFKEQHPKAEAFLNAVGREGMTEGSVLEFKCTTPEGKEYITNIRVTADDLETIEILKKISRK